MIELFQPLQRLETSELIRRLAESNAGVVDLAYLFKHALVQDTAYSSLLKNERRRLHRLIGQTLEQTYPEAVEENAALLFKHYLEAADDAKILEYGTCAGDAEARIFAKTEAIEHYKAAFEAAIKLESPAPLLIDLGSKLGRTYELQGAYTPALDTYSRLGELANARNDPSLELAALMLEATVRATPTPIFDPAEGLRILDRALPLAHQLRDGAAEAKILWNLLLVKGFTGHPHEAVEYGEQSLALARKLNLKPQVAYTLNDIGPYAYFASGQLEKARSALQEARGLWRELDNLPMLDDNLNNSGILDYILGDLQQARVYSAEAFALSQRISSVWGEVLSRTFQGVLSIEAGDFGTGLSELETAYQVGSKIGGILIIAATNLAYLYSMLGEIEEGYKIIQVADVEIEIALYRIPAKAMLAYLTFLRGDVETAEKMLADTRPRSPSELQFSYTPSIIAEGEIGLAAGRFEYVAEYMARLARDLRDFGVSNFIADAELYLGSALLRLGRPDEARAAFERGYTFAKKIASKRALRLITSAWAALEGSQDNPSRAAELQAESRAISDFIAASLPEPHSSKFRQQQRINYVA